MPKEPMAVLCSDIHLSHKPPIFRSNEPDWYAAMKRPLDELRTLANDLKVLIICAGDIFDKWNSPAELINFAIDNLPFMYTIPGQHDLPNHRLEDIKRSAYYTVFQTDRIKYMRGNREPIDVAYQLVAYGWPWGTECVPPVSSNDNILRIAVVHSYIWMNEKTRYPGASEDKKLSAYAKALEGYDAAVFGDNHKGFIDFVPSGGNLINCGTFMIRKSDEINYRPMVGVLYDDASIKPHYLDTSKDIYLDVEKAKPLENQADFSEFIENLQELGADSLDFREAVKHYLNNNQVTQRVRELALKAMEHGLYT